MIFIRRADEPAACPKLAQVRTKELERVRPLIEAGARADEDTLGKEYKVARTALARAQHYKCCYCEHRQQDEGWKQVEHFRPKSVYWWLTWTWENLLFACEFCNNRKRDDFPLAQREHPSAEAEHDLAAEDPHVLMIHPAREDPREHVQFVPVGAGWQPQARRGSARGREMVKILSVRGDTEDDALRFRPGLIDDWRTHVGHLEECIAEIQRVMETSDASRIRAIWERRTTRFRVARACYVALSIDVLDRYFPEEVRRRWELSLDVIRDSQ